MSGGAWTYFQFTGVHFRRIRSVRSAADLSWTPDERQVCQRAISSPPQTCHRFMSCFPSGGIKPAAFLLINAVICPLHYVRTGKSSFQTNGVQPLSRMITKRGLFSASQLLYSHWHNIKFHYGEFFIPFVTSQVPFLSTFGGVNFL